MAGPVMYCGADECCEGSRYPGCMRQIETAAPDKPAPDELAHYSDEQPYTSPCRFTD